jgi:hypothetical protein
MDDWVLLLKGESYDEIEEPVQERLKQAQAWATPTKWNLAR